MVSRKDQDQGGNREKGVRQHPGPQKSFNKRDITTKKGGNYNKHRYQQHPYNRYKNHKRGQRADSHRPPVRTARDSSQSYFPQHGGGNSGECAMHKLPQPLPRQPAVQLSAAISDQAAAVGMVFVPQIGLVPVVPLQALHGMLKPEGQPEAHPAIVPNATQQASSNPSQTPAPGPRPSISGMAKPHRASEQHRSNAPGTDVCEAREQEAPTADGLPCATESARKQPIPLLKHVESVQHFWTIWTKGAVLSGRQAVKDTDMEERVRSFHRWKLWNDIAEAISRKAEAAEKSEKEMVNELEQQRATLRLSIPQFLRMQSKKAP